MFIFINEMRDKLIRFGHFCICANLSLSFWDIALLFWLESSVLNGKLIHNDELLLNKLAEIVA